MTAAAHQAVTASTARIEVERTDRCAGLLRTTMPEGPVRDTILASPAWLEIAAAMGRLDAAGVDVARILAYAHRAGVGVDRPRPPRPRASSAPARVATASAGAAPGPAAGDRWAAPAPPRPLPPRPPRPCPPGRRLPLPFRLMHARPAPRYRRGTCWPRAWARPVSRGPAPARRFPAPAPAPRPPPAAAPPVRGDGEAAGPGAVSAILDVKRVWGPLAEGVTVPCGLDPGNRPRALKQLKVQPAAHSRMVAMVREVLPEREAGLLIGSWGERRHPHRRRDCGAANTAAPASSQALLCFVRRRADVLFAMLRDGTFYESRPAAAVT